MGLRCDGTISIQVQREQASAMLRCYTPDPFRIAQPALLAVALRANDHDVHQGVRAAQHDCDHVIRLFAGQRPRAIGAVRCPLFQLPDCVRARRPVSSVDHAINASILLGKPLLWVRRVPCPRSGAFDLAPPRITRTVRRLLLGAVFTVALIEFPIRLTEGPQPFAHPPRPDAVRKAVCIDHAPLPVAICLGEVSIECPSFSRSKTLTLYAMVLGSARPSTLVARCRSRLVALPLLFALADALTIAVRAQYL